MCINLYTLPKRSIAMLSWNVLTTSRQLLVTQLRFRYMFLSASWEHLDSFVRLLLTILDELFLVLNMFHEFSKVHGPSDRSRIVKKCQVVSRIGYRSRQEVSRHTIRHTSCSNSYSGTCPLISPLAILDTINCYISYLPSLKWNKWILTFNFETNASQWCMTGGISTMYHSKA